MRLWIAAVFGAWAAASFAASEVTVIRPSSVIAAEWTYHVVIGEQPVSDLRSGEHVKLQVPAGAQSLAIRCPKALESAYAESRIDYQFKDREAAFFVISPRSDCVSIQAVDAGAAATLLSRTRPRPASASARYDEGGFAPSAPSAPPARTAAIQPAPKASPSPQDEIAAATAAWVEAFNSRDPARIGAFYTRDAVVQGLDVKEAPQRPTERVALGERQIRVYGDTATDSGTYNFFEMRDGKAVLTPARYTLVYQKRGGRWLIVEHHSSPVPAP